MKVKDGCLPRELLFSSLLYSEQHDKEEWEEDIDVITEEVRIIESGFVIGPLAELCILTSILFSSECLSPTVLSCLVVVDKCAIDPVASPNDLL